MEFKIFVTSYRDRVNQTLTKILEDRYYASSLTSAMRYMLLGNGKRIRPLLVYATGIAFQAKEIDLDRLAAAVECIHVYSLIHDDLPAMDDDDLRHGKPSCHKQFNEALAILCGDALQALAFELLSQPFQHISHEKQIDIINTIASAAGPKGMVAGQVLDIEAEGKTIDLSNLEVIHRNKTGALIAAAIKIGALAGNIISYEQLKDLQLFAERLGLIFQIHDDIIDIESSTEKLGKQQGADLLHEKATYPRLLGLNEAKQLERTYLNEALSSLEKIKVNADLLKELTYFVIERDY